MECQAFDKTGQVQCDRDLDHKGKHGVQLTNAVRVQWTDKTATFANVEE